MFLLDITLGITTTTTTTSKTTVLFRLRTCCTILVYSTQAMLVWLEKTEERLNEVGMAASEIDAVREQIELLKVRIPPLFILAAIKLVLKCKI